MIDVALIVTHGRLRAIDPEQVRSLASSIKEVGLLNPITVYEREIVRNGVTCPGYGLVAGAHRLEACKALGWREIPATVVTLSDDERIIAECDENLCATKLSPADQAMFTAKRKEAYLRLHPETANGRNQHAGLDNLSNPTFADDQAAKTGVDARTVRRSAERGEKVTPEALAMVKGTALDKGAFLDRLKKIEPDKQAEYVAAEMRRASAPPPQAPDREDDHFDSERQVTELMAAWNKAGEQAREAFLARIAHG